MLITAFAVTFMASATGGELKTSYFGATKPGAWARYLGVTKDGSRMEYTYKRLADEDGRARM